MNDTLAIIQRITALEREVARLTTIEDPKVTLSSQDYRPLRIGDDATDWSTLGTFDQLPYTPDTMRVTVGATYVENTNQFISFPENYTGKPVVFTQPDGSIGIFPLVNTTTSGFFVTIYDTSATSTSGGIYWVALGPVDE